jgi:anti-sigma regulatory factor (Ser/Thr protein kinase)
MCLGLIKENDLISVSTLVCPEESYIFMFSDGLEKETVQAVLAADPAILQSGPPKGLCSRLLKRAGIDQQDDMVLLAYYIPQPGKPPGLCYSFKSTYEGVDCACAWAEEILTPGMIPSGKDVDFILLALREVMLNAVEHGNHRNPNAFVDIMVYTAPQHLIVEISDEGPGFDPAQTLAVAATPESLLGKRGMPAIRAAADSLTVEGGTVILGFNGQ